MAHDRAAGVEIFTDNKERSRFELEIDGEPAGWLDYLPGGASLILAHTQVAGGHRGHGVGGTLVRRALDAARADGKTVIATCPFALAYIDRHPDLDEFLAPFARRHGPDGGESP